MNFHDASLIFILVSVIWMIFYSIYVFRHIREFSEGGLKYYFLTLSPVILGSLLAVQQINPILSLNLTFVKSWHLFQVFILFLLTDFMLHYNKFLRKQKVIFACLFILMLYFLPQKVAPLLILFIPSFFILSFSLINLFFVRNKEYPIRQFFNYTLSGIVSLSLALIIKNALFASPYSQDILISILIVYSHYRLSNGILKFFTLTKTKQVHKFYGSFAVVSVSIIFFFIYFFVIIKHVFKLNVFNDQIIYFSFSASILFIILINLYSWLFKKLDSLLFPYENDYFIRLADCGDYLRKLLHIKEFVSFLSGIFNEFFEASHLTIMVINEKFEEGFRVVSNSSDKTIRQREHTRCLKNFFDKKNHFQVSDLTGEESELLELQEIMKILTVDNDINTFIKINHLSSANYVIAFHMKRLISWEKMNRIFMKSGIFGDCLDNILLYERKKNLLIQELNKTQREFDIRELEQENEELQKSYDKIRKLQNDIIKKERKAALTKFAISLDDEISNPLNNMLMAIQYQLEKIKSGKMADQESRFKLMEIIVSQSFRIKNILDELRKVADDYQRIKS